jgi:hypothetical protein
VASTSPLSDYRRSRLLRLAALKAEVERQAAIEAARKDVFAALDYVPTPRQFEFHEATEFSVLIGGSAGGGKTKALMMDAIRDCIRYPGIRIGAFRRTFGELRESLIAELAAVSFAQALGGVWNGSEVELRFPNGSIVMFRYAETILDATRRQGGQYQKLLFDEATLTAPDVITFIESRLRSANKKIPVLGVRMGSNPGGPGHLAIKTRFIDATDYGKRIATDARGRTVRFIPSSVRDNPHLNPEYITDLQALDEKMRRAFLEGDWSVFAGQAFALDRGRHLLDPIELPVGWKRFCGIDWGYAAPWCTLWAAVDEDGRVWVYRELYERGVGETEQADRILGAQGEDETILARYADDAMWATRGDALPIATIYAQRGVHLTEAGKGKGSRVAGWQRLRTYLAEAPACPHHRAKGWETCPKIHIFSTVENLIRTLPALPHASTGDPEDIDTTAEDHAADALRYMLINLGGGPEFVVIGEPEKPPSEPDPDRPGPLFVPVAEARAAVTNAAPAWWDPTEQVQISSHPPAWF